MAYEHRVSGYVTLLDGSRAPFDDTHLLVGNEISEKVWARLRAGKSLILYIGGKWKNVALNPDQVLAVVPSQGSDVADILAGRV